MRRQGASSVEGCACAIVLHDHSHVKYWEPGRMLLDLERIENERWVSSASVAKAPQSVHLRVVMQEKCGV